MAVRISTKEGLIAFELSAIMHVLSLCPSELLETGELEYATDTALDHMAVMDENESPVEVHITKN